MKFIKEIRFSFESRRSPPTHTRQCTSAQVCKNSYLNNRNHITILFLLFHVIFIFSSYFHCLYINFFDGYYKKRSIRCLQCERITLKICCKGKEAGGFSEERKFFDLCNFSYYRVLWTRCMLSVLSNSSLLVYN